MPDINMQVFEEVRRNQLVTEVDIQTQVALDNHQVKLADIANPMKSQDNVVIDRYGEFLPHWNESLDFDTWIKMSMEVAGKRVLMLHGDSNINSASNGNDVFEFFDHFLGSSLLGDWTTVGTGTETVTGSELIYDDYNANDNNPLYYTNIGGFGQNYAIRAKVKISEESAPKFGFSDVTTNAAITTTGNGHTIMIYHSAGANSLRAYSVVSGSSEGGTDQGDTDLNYNTYDIIKNGSTSVIFKQNDSTYATHVTKITSGAENVALSAHGIAATPDENYFDWVFVRKYSATEPTWGMDDIPQNIATALKSLGRAG